VEEEDANRIQGGVYSTGRDSGDSEFCETLMELSTAIISARMSRMGYDMSARLRGHVVSTYLGDRLVVDADELSGLGVDLEGLVEAQGGIDGV
jgi:hypothetical protein